MSTPPINPVILSGGSGSRLWPLSREQYPKQLLRVTGEHSLLQQTLLRLDGVEGIGEALLVCNEEHRFLVAEQLRALGRRPAAIVLEPAGRNTAPAATLAALLVQAQDPQGLMLLMPADHLVQDVAAFQRALVPGIAPAREGRIVTFGIVPTSAETGYGYIRRAADGRVLEFVEKPDAATAKTYVESGSYFWNSGMFLVRADVWLREMERHAPAILDACRAAHAQGERDVDFFRAAREAFLACPSDSIDYAVMEKTDLGTVAPLDAGWSDIGAWSALWNIGAHDAAGNVVEGDVLMHDTRDSFVVAQHRLVATVGLTDAVIVETPDAVLVADRARVQEVREIVERLKRDRRHEHLTHRRVYRPWGSYESIDAGERFQVKRLVVQPGAALSLQLHYHRAEHWVVVKGAARVTRGEEVFTLTENQSTYIPPGTRHRLENPGNIALEVIEVQSGAYLGEDDIVRFDDAYRRPVT